MTLENNRNKSLPQKKDKMKSSITAFGECFRSWEPYQKKGSDPNEVRMLDILECWTGELGPAIGLVGIPFDAAVLGRKGAKAGPKKIRDSIRYFKAYSWDLDYWFGDKKVYDFGDIVTEGNSVTEAHENIAEIIRKIAEKGFTTLTLGGDHSIGYPILKGLQNAHKSKKIGLINIDAHLDVREVIDGKITSGTPFRRVLDNNIVNGENFVEIGIRDFTNARTYRHYLEEKGATIFTMNNIRKRGLENIIQEAITIVGRKTDVTYLSIDMDSLDQIYAPGVSAPTPDGLSPHQINQIIHEIVVNTNIIGMDIVELNPLFDTADTTAINAANFLVQFVASIYWKMDKDKTE